MVTSLMLAVLLSAGSPAVQLEVVGKPELAFPKLVSTEKSEVKLTFSPDGSRMLWGATNWAGGVGGWDIWETVKQGNTWGKPHPVAFNSPSNDFDPSFARDGSGLFFFSNRPGGLGGDDIYFVSFDSKRGTYGEPVNLGPNVNSKGDEWGPVLAADGKTLLFCSDGRGGKGKHDLFTSKKVAGGWAPAESLGPAINSAGDDFDASFLDDGETLVFASERLAADQVDLFVSYRRDGKYVEPVSLGPVVNSPDHWDFGTSINPREPGVLYFNSNHPGDALGGADIYRVRYRLVTVPPAGDAGAAH